MDIDELWEKYSVEKFVKDSKLPFRLMDKIGFTEAIGEIISNPVEAEDKPANGGRWIDVNERLPKKYEDVLVVFNIASIGIDKVTIASEDKPSKSFQRYNYVKKWMPLPKP